MGGTVQYTFLQGASRPLLYVFRSERLFGSSDLSQDFFQIPLGRLAAIQDAGLVQMDMGFNETWCD